MRTAAVAALAVACALAGGCKKQERNEGWDQSRMRMHFKRRCAAFVLLEALVLAVSTALIGGMPANTVAQYLAALPADRRATLGVIQSC